MHESIAKAQTKGQFREVAKRFCAWTLSQSQRELTGKELKGRKLILTFVDELADSTSPLELAIWRYSRSTTWHKRVLQLYVFHEASMLKGLGNCYRVVARKLDTKGLNKGTDSGYEWLISPVVVHEHFLTRMRHRVALEDMTRVKKFMVTFVYVLSYFLDEEMYSKGIAKSVFRFITDNYVFIATYYEEHHSFILNTVILREYFSPEQSSFYEPLIEELNNEGQNCALYSDAADDLFSVQELQASECEYQAASNLTRNLFFSNTA